MSGVRKARVTITLNRALLHAVDRDAKARHQPRSVVIEERLQQSELDRQIREYYGGQADNDRAEDGAEALARLNQFDPWPDDRPTKKVAKRKK